MSCRYCGGPLVALGAPDPRTSTPCERCHRAVAATSNFCGACGHRAPTRRSGPRSVLRCPGCGGDMEHHTIAGDQPVEACRRCGGVWAPRSTLEAVIEAARARPLPKDRPPRKRVGHNVGKVVYRRCPVCEQMMARRNFARISGVILDSCPEHGTYFDYGELPDVVDFVRGGGLELAQRKENEELAREKARLEHRPVPGGAPMGDYTQTATLSRGRATSGLDLVASFVGWAVWWGR